MCLDSFMGTKEPAYLYSKERRFRYSPTTREFQELIAIIEWPEPRDPYYATLPPVPKHWSAPKVKKPVRRPVKFPDQLPDYIDTRLP